MAQAADFSLFTRTRPDGAVEMELAVEGIACGGCIARIERTLLQTPGVVDARVNFTNRRLSTAWRPAATAPERIISTLKTKYSPDNQVFTSQAEARREIFEFIVLYYNSRRLHSCQTQNYLRMVQRYLRMVENFAMLHYSLLQRAPPENHCVLTQLRWPLRSNCCPAVQFDGGADAT